MRILLLADLHIGARLLDWDRTSQRVDPIRAWSDAVDLALSASADAVLVAGDLFDGPDPDPEAVAAVTAGVARLVEAGRTVVILPGAYDGLCRPSCFYLGDAVPAGCHVVTWPEPDRVSLEIGDETLHLYGFASIPGRTPAEPFAALRRGEGDGYHVGLVHARLEGEPPVVPGGTDWGRPPLSLDDASMTGFDLLVVGGGHGFRSEICGVVPVIQPGSPLPLRPHEDRSRAFTVAILGSGGVEIERHSRDGEAAVSGEEAAGGSPAPAGGSTELLQRLRDEGSVRGLFVRRLETLLEETEDPAQRKILERALILGLEEFNRLEVARAD